MSETVIFKGRLYRVKKLKKGYNLSEIHPRTIIEFTNEAQKKALLKTCTLDDLFDEITTRGRTVNVEVGESMPYIDEVIEKCLEEQE